MKAIPKSTFWCTITGIIGITLICCMAIIYQPDVIAGATLLEAFGAIVALGTWYTKKRSELDKLEGNTNGNGTNNP